MIYIFWSCRNKAEAKTIIHLLLDKKLIACASVLPEVESIYRWEGSIEESSEAKIILKTQSKHFDAICKIIEDNCTYEVPEITQVEVSRANPRYLSWMFESTNN